MVEGEGGREVGRKGWEGDGNSGVLPCLLFPVYVLSIEETERKREERGWMMDDEGEWGGNGKEG